MTSEMAVNEGSITSKKSIVFILPSFEIGGAQRVSLTLLSGLDLERYSPSLVVFENVGELANMVPDGTPVHALQCRRLRGAFVKLAGKLRELHPDIVFSTLGYINLALLAMRPVLAGRPRLVIRESNLPSQSLPKLNFARTIKLGYRCLYSSADLVICQSQRMGEELTSDFAVPANCLARLSNPVDSTAIRKLAEPPVRQPGTGLRLVAGGRLTAQKGFDRLLRMFAELPPDAHLTILGEGADRAVLEDQARALEISDRVAMPGFLETPWPLFAGADAMVLPSRWEGMPNVALEALACGTPVIGTPEAGGLTEVADLSSPGAVILATAGAEFVAAMGTLSPRQLTPRRVPRDSLLPSCFDYDNVVAQFSALLAD
jgi:glycosyltransferase involved in cell wall biosynthesis